MDFVFNNMEAAINSWNSLTLLMIGVPFSLIGIICIGFWFGVRFFTERYEGKILSVKVKGKVGSKKKKSKKARYDDYDKYDSSSKRSDVDQYNTSVVDRKRNDFRDKTRQRLSSASRKYEKSDKKDLSNGGKGGTIFIFCFLMIFFGVGGYFGYSYLSLAQNGYLTQGVIVDFDESYDSESGYTYNAIVEYRDSHGRTYRNRDHIGKGSASYLDRRGERVEVYYDPANPDKFAIADFWHNMLLPFIFMAVPFIIWGVLILASKGKSKSDLGFNDENDQSYSSASAAKFASEMYYCVYEYIDRYGTRHEAHSSSGSNSILNKIPGTPVTLFVRSSSPNQALRSGYFSLILGIILLIPGAGLSYFGLRSFEFNPVSIFMILGILAYVGTRIFRTFNRANNKQSRTAQAEKFKNRPSLGHKRDKLPDLSMLEVRQRLEASEKVARQTSIVFGIIAIGMLVGSYFWAQHHNEFVSLSSSANGYVEQMVSKRSSSSNGSTTYYAKVSFVDAQGRQYKFRDKVGSSIKLHEVGDEVKVMYDPNSPRDAIIDRGIFNYFPQLIMAGFAALILLSVLSRILGSKSRRSSRHSSYS